MEERQPTLRRNVYFFFVWWMGEEVLIVKRVCHSVFLYFVAADP
jgi:hypothetical protein